MPTVELQFTALPAHVRTARLIATAVARRAGVPEEVLDEVRLAVGEACSRAVGIHQRHAPDTPVGVALTDEQDRFTVVVSDCGDPDDGHVELAESEMEGLDPATLAEPDDPGNPGDDTDPLPDLLPAGFGLAVITGLVEDVEVSNDTNGTHVRMTWPAHDVMAPDADSLG